MYTFMDLEEMFFQTKKFIIENICNKSIKERAQMSNLVNKFVMNWQIIPVTGSPSAVQLGDH